MSITDYPNIEFLNFKNVNEALNIKMYKSMPLERALETLKTKKLWFAEPSKWSDPFESKFLNAKYNINNVLIDYPFKGQVFCTCVTTKNLSEAHWNIYSRGDIGIQFRINVLKLYSMLNVFAINHPKYKIFIGKVEYHDTQDISQNHISSIPFKNSLVNRDINDKTFGARLLLLKRNAFSADEEIRIIIFRDKKYKKKGSPNAFIDGFSLDYNNNIINIKNNELFEKVKIAPNVKNHTTEMLKNTLARDYGMVSQNQNAKSIVEKCHLYDKMPSEIIYL